MPSVRNLLLHNWHLKLLSVVIAFFLWATYTGEPAAEVGFQVPLEFRNLPDTLEISGDVPAQIYVRVRGRASRLRELTSHDFSIPLDLAGARPGEKFIRINDDVVDEPLGTEVVRITPDSVRLVLVPRGSRAPAP